MSNRDELLALLAIPLLLAALLLELFWMALAHGFTDPEPSAGVPHPDVPKEVTT